MVRVFGKSLVEDRKGLMYACEYNGAGVRIIPRGVH